MVNRTRFSKPNSSGIRSIYDPMLARATEVRKALEGVRFDPEETREERAYVRYLLQQGLTHRQAATQLRAPWTFVQRISKDGEALPPPPGFMSKLIDLTSDSDKAAHAKWLLKHGTSPEEVAFLLRKSHVWVYQIISGKTFRFIKPLSPEIEREITITPKKMVSKKAKLKAEKAPTKSFIEAGYILGLSQKYAVKDIARIAGRTEVNIRSIINGTVHHKAIPTEMPEGYWDLTTASDLKFSTRQKKTQEACWILWLHERFSTQQIVEGTGVPYARVYSIIKKTTSKAATPIEPPAEFWKPGAYVKPPRTQAVKIASTVTTGKRVHVSLTPDSFELLKQLRKRTEVGSLDEVIWNALKFYSIFRENVEAGNRLVFAAPGEAPIELKIEDL